jgi:hypothetical protein
MTSNGNPSARKRQPFSLGALAFAFVVVALAGALGVQLLSVLYAVLFPPLPPLPSDTRELSYTQKHYGVDEWLYSIHEDACEVAVFYAQASPLTCPVPPFCAANSVVSGLDKGMNVSRCGGELAFSAFVMSWNVIIGVDESDANKTVLRLSREVFWGGVVPPAFDALMPTESAD